MKKLQAFFVGIAVMMGAKNYQLPYVAMFDPIPNVYFKRELKRRASLPPKIGV